MKVLRNIVGKTKIDRIRSQQITESYGIQPINDGWKEEEGWDVHLTRMDAEKLLMISSDNIPAGIRSPGCPRRRWSNLILD